LLLEEGQYRRLLNLSKVIPTILLIGFTNFECIAISSHTQKKEYCGSREYNEMLTTRKDLLGSAALQNRLTTPKPNGKPATN
jgi:hypothetical protein